MISTLIFPEFLLLKSVSDYSAARKLTEQVGWRAERDGVGWSMVHSYFANMGGFVIEFKESVGVDVLEPSHSLDERKKVQVQETVSSDVSIKLPKTPSNEHDCEMAIPGTKATISLKNNSKANKQTRHQKQKLSSHQAWLMRLITTLEKRLPKSEHRNTLLVRSALTDLKELASTEEGAKESKDSLNNKVINLVRLRTRYWALDGPQLALARELGIISKLPNVSEVDIEEKSNSDALAEFLAVLQTLWQIGELFKRWAQHEPSSQIEVVTVAYCVCTFFIYVMFWNKPQQIDRPFLISPIRWPTKEEMIQISDIGPGYELGLFTGFQYHIPENAIHGDLETSDSGLAGGYFGWFGGIFGGVLFGLIHCLAWNFRYPTTVEGTLWRISSMVTSIVPILFGVRSLAAVQRLERRVPFMIDFVAPALGGILGLVYIFCRMFLLVETFRSLAFLPPGSYRK